MINKKFLMAAGIFILVFCILSGCEKKRTKEELILLPVETNVETGTAKAETVEKEEAETNAQENDRLREDADSAITEEAYVVHICGAVENPGIYMLEAGSRIYQAIDAAGGLCEDAAGDYLNQADTLTDGMKIYVPTKAEVEASGEGSSWQIKAMMASEEDSRMVNINTADEELLCTLPGVGSSRAKSIIAYRERNGAFQKIEEIMNVEGIKEGLFQKIRDSITV
ncbi:MAG: helix-hairpin-helix domain-containing protein [Firmicutes bacterium]|nr:helix-hairpin-helix domain-containing protein [Bacillota bacterium]